jgi:2-polyprenyl-3-methyl-5-hydroxy-6-metoxy-1,4-benzoquinol methylase
MALNIYKPIDNPQHISILIPTRGRSHYLTKVFNSIEETTKDKSLVDVWIYVDDDDETTKQFIDTYPKDKHSFKIAYVVGPRTNTQGEMTNILREKCTTNPGIYMPAADDYLFVTKHWDNIVREMFNRYPDRILLAYPVDPLTAPDQVTHVILSAEWTNILGRFPTEYFPFWSDDTWLDQVSQMVQRKIRLDMQMEPQGGYGKTPRMKNLLFWQRFFNNTMDERIEDANLLRKAIYQENSPQYNKSVEEGDKLVKRFIMESKEQSDEDLILMEKRFSVVPENSKPQIDYSYLIAETNAVNHLYKKLGPLINQGRSIEVLNILDNLMVAFQNKDKDIKYCRVIWQGRFRRIWQQFRRACRALRNPTKYPEYAKRIYHFLLGRRALLVKDPIFYNSKESNNERFYTHPHLIKEYLSEERIRFYQSLIQVLIDKRIFIENKNVADVGCGMGYQLKLLVGYNPASLTGLDFSSAALEIARKVCPDGRFYEFDIYGDYNEKFDIVLCTEVLEHLLYPSIALKNILSMINPQGCALLTVPNGRTDTFLGHINFWSPECWKIFIETNCEGFSCDIGLTKTSGDNYAIIQQNTWGEKPKIEKELK